MSVKPGEIVEVSCRIPNDIAKVHMVLVVSTDKISEVESGMFYGVMITSNPSNSEYKLEIKDDMLLKPLSKKSYFATHLMSFFESEDIIKHCVNGRIIGTFCFVKKGQNYGLQLVESEENK